uniref:FA complementation group D2 n=1 Tax=Cynoglossus semilaevis TaxID=244447 RepID=A0A3P8UR59_CYNSE
MSPTFSSIEAKKSRSTGRPPKEAVPEEINENVFTKFLREAGVTLRNNGTAVDQVVFQKRIQQQIRKNPKYPEIVQEFISGLESHIEEPERFRNCLLPCVPRLSDGDDSVSDGGLNIPRLIITQLKWLDRVVDSKELAAKLMELVSVAPVDVVRDIITSLPEILEDCQHNDIARELNSLLQTNTQLTVPILDSLSSLNLSASLLAEVRAAVMATLSAVQLEDLPVVVKFILHSVSAADSHEVVNNLRRKLQLEQCVLPPVSQASQSLVSLNRDASRSGAGDSVTLTLDGIKSAVRFQKTISEAWMKAIESVEEVIDLLVLFILHSTNANQSRRGSERLLKVKVRTGLIQEALLQKTFRDYSQVLRGYFSSILALAQGLLRSSDPCVVPFGGHMYRLSFTVFDPYCQQEVVGSLVTHVCSGVGGEVDMALELLCDLVTEKPSEMALYAVFVKVKKKSHCLVVTRFKCDQTEKMFSAQVNALLELVRSSSESSSEATALFYDELANLVMTSDLDPKVQVGPLCLAHCFFCSLDCSPVLGLIKIKLLLSFPLPTKLLYNLEDLEENGIAINLLPLLSNDLQTRAEQVSPLCLSPSFRLLRVCEKQESGSLENIDGLLGCPLVMTDMDLVEKVESLSKTERELLCHLLFYTINWFRELVNAFCGQKDTELKMRVMTRLQNITYLQTQLEKALAGTPGFVPPVANFDGDATDGAIIAPPAPANKTKKGNGTPQKTPQMTLVLVLKELPEKEKEKEKEVAHGVSLVSYRQFFRELDVEVLNVLQCGLLSCSLLDSELHTNVQEEVQLGPAELVFLLEDMLRKLEFSLTSAPVRRAPFLKSDKSVGFSHLQQRSSKDIAAFCVQLLPALCAHLENCHNHFQTLSSRNDGVVDGPATDVQEQHLMTSCYQLLLQVLNTTFSWSGFSLPGNRSLYRKGLGVLAERLKGRSELNMEQLVKWVPKKNFFLKVGCNMQNCLCQRSGPINNNLMFYNFITKAGNVGVARWSRKQLWVWRVSGSNPQSAIKLLKLPAVVHKYISLSSQNNNT